MTGPVMLSLAALDGTTRVAGRRGPLRVAGSEPLLTLLGGPMRPRIRVDLALRRLLDPVVADGRGRIESIGDLRVGECLEITRARRVVGPDACEAVGLELGPDRASGRTRAATGLRQEVQQVLDVVAVLMGKHVTLGERATLRAEPRAELLEEVEVEIDERVVRAVERPRGGAGGPAAAVRRTGEQDG